MIDMVLGLISDINFAQIAVENGMPSREASQYAIGPLAIASTVLSLIALVTLFVLAKLKWRAKLLVVLVAVVVYSLSLHFISINVINETIVANFTNQYTRAYDAMSFGWRYGIVNLRLLMTTMALSSLLLLVNVFLKDVYTKRLTVMIASLSVALVLINVLTVLIWTR